MATFGKQFLQQMANPSFGKGLFTAAEQIGAAPAKRRMQEQLASATPLERFDLAIAQLTRAGELEKAAKLEANKAKFITDRQVAQDKLITNVVSGQMVSAGTTEVPKSVVVGGKTVDIPARLESEILEAANTLQNRRDGRETVMTEGELSQYYIDQIKNNPILQENPQVVDSFNKLNDPQSGLLRTQRIRLVKNLMTAVDEEVDRQFSLRTGEKAAKIRINNLIDDIKKAGSNMWFWQDDDMANALEDMSDSERNTFIDQAALYYQTNPNATDQQLIDVGMSGMREKIPGQEQSAAISAAEREEAAEKEAIIQAYMQRDGLTREEAIDRLKSDNLSSAIFSAGKAIATGGNLSVTGGN
jgi:hypothetical protein